MKRIRLSLALLLFTAVFAGCAEPKPKEPPPPPPNPRVQSLLDQRHCLENARAEVADVHGENSRPVRVIDHEIKLVDQQIELEED